ncbi:MAG TPA: GAF domain-containing protein [Candidatus Saccharimonadia bacterium]|nr:GAF domain-containing protein [Candidatus Saccharimonadia bacterium]
MTERNVHALRAGALAMLAEATRAANGATDVENALGHLTAATREVLGDKEAHLRPGGLRTGERQFVVACIFLITPDRQHNLLVAEHGFPPEQHRLCIPLDFGPPGWVVQHQRPRMIANTDEAPDFRQILKTSHMGSALYGPMVWRGEMLGQLLTAAQARHTYGPIDLDLFMSFAHVAAAVYMAHGGPAWLRTLV